MKLNQLIDVSNEEYHAHEAIGRSGLMLYKRSPLHFRHKYIDKKQDDNKSHHITLGAAIHTAILEPDLFDERFYLAGEKPDRRTKQGKQLWNQIDLVSEKKQIIYQDDATKITDILTSISKNKIAKSLIVGGKYEKTIFWKNPEYGILCKCRPDIFHENMIIDLKTTSDASPGAFRISVNTYGYHIQAAMIQEAVYIATNKLINDFIYIVVETTAPYATAVYTLSQDYLEKGKSEFLTLLSKHKECTEKQEWNSYDVQEISLSSYAI